MLQHQAALLPRPSPHDGLVGQPATSCTAQPRARHEITTLSYVQQSAATDTHSEHERRTKESHTARRRLPTPYSFDPQYSILYSSQSAIL